MKNVIVILFLFSRIVYSYESTRLIHSESFILDQVLKYMNIKLKPSIQLPEIVYADEAILSDFQKEVEPQWGIKPDFITNVYLAQLNKIYLLDEKNYYDQNERCIDDSLAHEIVHFVQVKYRKIPIEYLDDSMEMEAIDVQSHFRNDYCPPK